VPHPSARRKGWRSVPALLAVFIAAAVVSFPVSFIGAMLMTPLLYRLEPVLGMELAGHSGPADWILIATFGITTIAVAGVILWIRRPSRTNTSPRAEESAAPPRA